jgi:hypothetical protein
MKTITLALFTAILALGQDVTDVRAIAKTATVANTIVATITGTDGTICKLAKVAGNTISAVFACGNTASTNVMRTAQLQATGTAPSTQILGQDTVLCLLVLNPTSAAYPAGTVGNTPAKGLGWSCTGDGISANIQTGSVVWP